jgi:hypothetical protein
MCTCLDSCVVAADCARGMVVVAVGVGVGRGRQEAGRVVRWRSSVCWPAGGTRMNASECRRSSRRRSSTARASMASAATRSRSSASYLPHTNQQLTGSGFGRAQGSGEVQLHVVYMGHIDVRKEGCIPFDSTGLPSLPALIRREEACGRNRRSAAVTPPTRVRVSPTARRRPRDTRKAAPAR